MKIKYCLLLIITACVIVFACRKVEFRSNSSANSQLVDAARKWFEEKHANDIATIRGFVANGRLTSRVKNVFAGEPDWKLARPYMGNLGILVVLDSRNDRKGHVMFRDLLITKDSSGGFKEYIQSVYFDSAYISSLVAGKGKLADIRSYSDPGTFTGRVILTTVYNQLVRGAVFENGQLVKGIEPTARALRNKKINPAPTVNLYSSVPGSAITPVGVDIGTGGDLDDNNGDGGGSWNDNGDNTAGPDVNVTADPKPTLPPGTGPVINPPLPDPGNYSPTIPTNYGGGGGGYKQQPTNNSPLMDSINPNNLDSPCLKNAVINLATNPKLNTELANLFRNTFGASQNMDVVFYQTPNPPAGSRDDMANTVGIVYGNYIKIDITFIESALKGASQELITETTLHEIIHAYLDQATNDYHNPYDWQHEMMVGYIDCERETLQAIFPNLSNTDANGLILAGLLDPLHENPSYDIAGLLSEYGLTEAQVNNIEQLYEHPNGGGKGTPCGNLDISN